MELIGNELVHIQELMSVTENVLFLPLVKIRVGDGFNRYTAADLFINRNR